MKRPAIADTMAGGQLLALGLLAASAGGCGIVPGWTSSAGPVPVVVPFETIDGYELGPARTVSGVAFHRLESDARATWLALHPGDVLSGFELRSPAGSTAPGTAPADLLEFLVVVTVVPGERHVVELHCDASAFPATGSCS